MYRRFHTQETREELARILNKKTPALFISETLETRKGPAYF